MLNLFLEISSDVAQNSITVFEFIISMFTYVINWLKAVPVFGTVSMYHFSVALLVMSIVIVAFVNVVRVDTYSMGSNITYREQMSAINEDKSNYYRQRGSYYKSLEDKIRGGKNG